MKNLRMSVWIALALCVVMVIGCGGGTKNVKIEQNVEKGMAVSVPEAYTMNYASDTTAIYGKGTALSKDMQVAVDQASLVAEREIATLMQSKIERYSTYLVRQEGDPKELEMSYKDATKRVVDQTIQGKEEHFRTINREGVDYRAYVVLKMPVGKANKALLDQIKKNEELWRMYKDDKQIKELEENVRRYEESKKNQ